MTPRREEQRKSEVAGALFAVDAHAQRLTAPHDDREAPVRRDEARDAARGVAVELPHLLGRRLAALLHLATEPREVGGCARRAAELVARDAEVVQQAVALCVAQGLCDGLPVVDGLGVPPGLVVRHAVAEPLPVLVGGVPPRGHADAEEHGDERPRGGHRAAPP